MRAPALLRAAVFGIVLGTSVTACHRGPALDPGAAAPTPAPVRRPAPVRTNRDVISIDEIIATTEAQDAYDVVRRLRPRYLVDRGPMSFRNTVPRTALVYVDNVRMGGLEALRTIPRDGIAEIRYYSGPDATTRWGTGHGSGVIYVATRH